ncbi:trk system potassium uptake protein TrkA [Ruminococcaceae bacterium YRB3002]|nr:trk system potassium uptake protein TrkA [Ruminococcaceae bacterium YRB3002]
MYKSFAILGMGRFGQELARTLYEKGADVLIADDDSELINQLSSNATYAVCTDLTEPDNLAELGLSNMDVVVICMSRHVEASVMCAMFAKEAGVPLVVAKAGSERMGRLLMKVGADQITYVEEESARRAANHLVSDNLMEYFDLSDNLCIIDMKPKKEWIGKNLKELKLRDKLGINVIAIKKGTSSFPVDPDAPIKNDVELIVAISKRNIKKVL